MVLDAARDKLREKIQSTQDAILREREFPPVKYFKGQENDGRLAHADYLKLLIEAHDEVLEMLDRLSHAEAEQFGRDMAEYFGATKTKVKKA